MARHGLPLLPLLLLLVGAWLKLGNGQATSMVQLQGGRFLMGTNSPDSRDGEGPVQEVTVKPFAIDIFPVTNKDFRDFVREKKYQTEAEMFGWSFVFEDFVSDELRNKATQPMKVKFIHGGTSSSQTAPTCGRASSQRETKLRMASMESPQ
ncbi:SUMF2 isoform 3 [Pongo abelii]|uniref:SUMF2 isoform 3 n=1 Tax=Pongo abelii TaxID=9601 RepID=A0A2J8R5K2_PONAB|nr:SUMF2 isoform 3 [Pongo abelii]